MEVDKTRPSSDFPLVVRVPKDLRKSIKQVLSYLPSSYTAKLLAQWPDFRLWKARHLNSKTPCFDDRLELYRHLLAKEIPDRFVYLEFGCAAGKTVEIWADAAPHPDCRFIGFDTFEGMPERWRGLGWSVSEGAWSQHGVIPETADSRVSYVRGKFQQTLEPLIAETDLLNSFEQYVVHIDADLYSAALYVLTIMRPVLHKATILFDEFNCVMDEMRALDDFCGAFGYTYSVLGTATQCEKVAIRFNLT